MKHYYYLLCSIALLLVGCSLSLNPPTPTSTPAPLEFITFRAAYAIAQIAVKDWNENGVLLSVNGRENIEFDQSGKAVTWSFRAGSPMRRTNITVHNNRVHIGAEGKAELFCIDQTFKPAPVIAHELGCAEFTPTVKGSLQCIHEAAAEGKFIYSICSTLEELQAYALRGDEMDSTEAVAIARASNSSLIDKKLVGMRMDGDYWTLVFKNPNTPYVTVNINLQTGNIE